MVTHCLLVETDADEGLVLVDTGLGEINLDKPKETLGTWFIKMLRFRVSMKPTMPSSTNSIVWFSTSTSRR